MTELSNQPIRRISSWKVFGVFCLISFLILFGIVFIPWDVQAPDDADLQFTPPKVDADKNAFTYLEAAGNLQVTEFPLTTEPNRDWTNLLNPIGNKSEEWNPAFADQVLKANESAFKELEVGLVCDRYASPQYKDFKTFQKWLQKHKQLTELLCLKSKRAQLAGDPVAAAQAATLAWRLGQLVTNDANSLMEWLAGTACERIGLARMNEIVSDVRTPEPVLRDLLAQLERWNSKGIERGYTQAMQEDYQLQLTVVEQLPSTPDYYKYLEYGDPNLAYWARIPYFFKLNMTKRILVPFYRNLIANADRVYAKANVDYPGRPRDIANDLSRIAIWVSPNVAGKKLFFLLAPTLDRVIAKKCLLQTTVAGLRLKIALRLYEQRHGQLPDDLNVLVPEYLKEIPLDPYDGKPFRYSKAEKRVWATGSDLVDNGGKMREDTEMVDAAKSMNCDVGFRLETREMKPTPPPPAAPGSKPEENPF